MNEQVKSFWRLFYSLFQNWRKFFFVIVYTLTHTHTYVHTPFISHIRESLSWRAVDGLKMWRIVYEIKHEKPFYLSDIRDMRDIKTGNIERMNIIILAQVVAFWRQASQKKKFDLSLTQNIFQCSAVVSRYFKYT